MRRTRLQVIAAGVAATAFFFVLGGPRLAASAAEKPIVIGASISETGAYADSGKLALQGYQLWVKQRNAAGGLLGRQIELKTYDDASDPATAVRLYQRLIDQDHVDLIVGPYSSAVTASVANVAQQHHMPMISPEVASTAPFERGLTEIFQGIQIASDYVEGPIAIAKEKGFKTIAVTGEDTLFPRSVVAGVDDLAKKMGMTVVFNQLYPHNASDYSSIVEKMKQSNPDIVIAASYLPDSVGLLRAMKQANFAPKLVYEGVGPTELSFGTQNGKDADGVMGTGNWSAELKTQGNASFVKAFTSTFGHPPDYHAAANYASLEVLGEAVKRVGSLDSAKLRDQLATLTMPTVMGTYKVDPKTGIQQGYKSLVLQWVNGKQFVIYPKALAQQPPSLPFVSWSTR
ncbi:hypothetical protein EPN42_02550 [bacterium]|nr:MAG: hypothetical protein EPN42_02550 [bacterium]